MRGFPSTGLTPAEALREYAYWLERERADKHRIDAYRRAAKIADQFDAAEVASAPTTEKQWRALPGFGPSTAAIAAEAASGELPALLAQKRAEGKTSLAPAGDLLRATLRGDLHTHTTWSDGTASLAEMVSTADSLGHQYLAITDHSPRLTIAHGLSRESLAAQWAEIAEVQRHHDLRSLRGIEVDILGQGALDQADDMLDQLDIVTASVHSDLHADSATMTRRLVSAVSNRHTTVLGHVTGRKLRPDGTWRPQSSFDAEIVFAACALFGVAVEINARPDRNDPPLELLAMARDAGCLFSIDSDAHAPGQLDFLTYGAARAAEVGIDPQRIITSWAVDDLLAHARRNR